MIGFETGNYQLLVDLCFKNFDDQIVLFMYILFFILAAPCRFIMITPKVLVIAPL